MGESIAAEVIAGSLGGAFSASVLYPLEVLKTKMQAESKSSATSSSSSTPEATKSENADQESNAEDDIEVIGKPECESASNNKKQSMTMIEYARDMYAKNGITPFYAGIETSAFQSATEKALYFFAYTTLKNTYSLFTGSKKQMGAAVNLILGCMAEWAHLPITLPLDCWTTQIQTGDNGNKAPLAILMSMLSEGDGIKGMYKGIQAYTVLCLKPAIQYTVFEQVKGMMLIRKKLLNANGGKKQNTDTLTTSEAFLLGMVARTIATVAVYPYLRAKVMLQSQKKAPGESSGTSQKPNIPAMILKMYSNGGLGECFQGIGPELTRGVFSAALMMACKEKIGSVVSAAITK
jgi:hypothetical protein